jgi:GTP:adenosylcobinamide-phosphate guanylyltransferase
MDAIVIAGGIPRPEDSLYPYSNGDSKALIDVAGKPMVQWVLDAISDSVSIKNVIVIGLSPKSDLKCKKPMVFISNQGRMLANIVAGVRKSQELDKKNQYVMIVSSDVPAVKGEMLDWLAKTAMQTKDELYYGVCPRDTMEARYPNSTRTYTKLADMQVCGADVNLIHVRMISDSLLQTWESLINNRKNVFKQAAVLGWDTLFQIVTRQFTLDAAVKRASERIGIKARAIIWPYAEACMDVDKPHQLELMREDLGKAKRKAASLASKIGKTKSIKGKPVAKKAAPKKKVLTKKGKRK